MNVNIPPTPKTQTTNVKFTRTLTSPKEWSSVAWRMCGSAVQQRSMTYVWKCSAAASHDVCVEVQENVQQRSMCGSARERSVWLQSQWTLTSPPPRKTQPTNTRTTSTQKQRKMKTAHGPLTAPTPKTSVNYFWQMVIYIYIYVLHMYTCIWPVPIRIWVDLLALWSPNECCLHRLKWWYPDVPEHYGRSISTSGRIQNIRVEYQGPTPVERSKIGKLTSLWI